MAKLGKKARKFAKKNLQSVMKRKRKFNSAKGSSRRKQSSNHAELAEDNNKAMTNQLRERSQDGTTLDGGFAGKFLDVLFSEDDDNLVEDVSDSDGFLSEDPDCPYVSETDQTDDFEGENESAVVVGKNTDILLELTKQKRKLDKLREKDPSFATFLESYCDDLKRFRTEEASSDEEMEFNDVGVATASQVLNPLQDKTFTTYTIDVWCWMAVQNPSISALPNLFNAFRAACHYGIGDSGDIWRRALPNKEAYSKVLTFVLSEADGIFRRLLGLSDFCYKESGFKLKSTPECMAIRPLIKSYLRSSLFLLNQLTDSQILAFTLSRLRVSIMFFSMFPSLIQRLIKAAVHFWATGDNNLSLSSFFLIRDIATELSSEYLETCLTKPYRGFVSHCKYIEPANLMHVKFLSDCLVELYSLNVNQSYQKVLIALQQLANILKCAVRTKKKEELQRIYSWQYMNCLDVWVKFISQNIGDHDLQPLLYLVIQIVTGVAHLFPGRRYLPLRIRCVQMLNQVSCASGIFIPVVSLVLDSLEYEEINNENARLEKAHSLSSLLKVPKQLLKSRGFQEECVLSALQQLSAHFAQWNYNISFPELATIPLIILKKFHEKTSAERLRHLVKRLIEQVEQNIDFVQRKRDDVSFSPNDQISAESFLQLEKSNRDAPLARYFSNIQQKSKSRKLAMVVSK